MCCWVVLQILQNLGKADRTVDDVFDDYEQNFNKQQTNANRIHKEVANYLRCCRGMYAPVAPGVVAGCCCWGVDVDGGVDMGVVVAGVLPLG